MGVDSVRASGTRATMGTVGKAPTEISLRFAFFTETLGFYFVNCSKIAIIRSTFRPAQNASNIVWRPGSGVS